MLLFFALHEEHPILASDNLVALVPGFHNISYQVINLKKKLELIELFLKRMYKHTLKN